MREMFATAVRRAVVLLLLCGLGWAGDRLASRPPAWLRQDPIVHPFGLGSNASEDSLKFRAAEGDTLQGETVADLPPITAQARLAINRATARDLERLPRIGPTLAARIVAMRDSLGGFTSPQDLRRVKGIGASTLARLAPLLDFR
jgi:competence ComEA-like helix-hairpin-helix protein